MVPVASEAFYLHIGFFEASANGTLAVVLLFLMVLATTALRLWRDRLR